jgi:hypothetical protein
MVVGAGDDLRVVDEALAASNCALAPNKLVVLSGGRFDAFTDDFGISGPEAADWFGQHLG